MANGRTTAKDTITPDFEKRSDGTKIGSASDETRGGLRAAEKDAATGVEKSDGAAEAETKASERGGLYKGTGKETAGVVSDGGKPEMKLFGKKLKPLMAVAAVAAIAMAVVMIVPTFMLGQMHEGFLNSFWFKATTAILEEQAEHVTSEFLGRGKMPEALADDFLAYGLEVGQVTLAGEFVRTNTYIADLGSAVAANGEYVANGEGELAVRFNGEIVTADNFVAVVESSPEMYAAYSEALNMSSRYYYSDAVNDVYNNMGVTRGMLNSVEVTGDSKTDKENLEAALTKALDKESNRGVSGQYLYWYRVCVEEDDDGNCIRHEWVNEPAEWECIGSGTAWTCSNKIAGSEPSVTKITGEPAEVATSLVNYVAEHSRDDRESEELTAEENAAQILNTLLSADEPYKAASTFVALMEVLERAKIEGTGPVNEMMNLLAEPREYTYVDINTNQTVTEKKSMLETYNFQIAAGSNEGYSKTEALNMSRDRILKASNTGTQASVQNMPLSTNAKKKSGDGLVMTNDLYDCPGESLTCLNNRSASLSGLAGAIDSIRVGVVEKNSDVFGSVLGAERVLEGGSFVSNTINQQVIGAMPSDAEQIANYRKEVDTVLARQAEAERATKSPFDISSPNTLMGNLVRKISSVMLSNYAKNKNMPLVGALGTMGDLAGGSLRTIAGIARADGNEDGFMTTAGECIVVPTASGAMCELYGTAVNTVYTGYESRTKAEWEAAVSEEEAEKFVSEAMKRDATVGIESYDVCETSKENEKKDEEGNKVGGVLSKVKGFFGKVVSAIKRLIPVVVKASELEDGCNGVEPTTATGSENVLHGSNGGKTAELSGYALHSAVYSLLGGDEDDEAE